MSGNVKDEFSGGFAGYVEGSAITPITGTAILWEDTGNVVRVPSAVNPLPVNVVAGTITGISTEYVEGSVVNPITGAAILWEDTGNVVRVPSAVNPLPVNVVTGAVTEYVEGSVITPITGTAILWEDTGNVVRIPSAVNPLPVNIITGSSSGTTDTDDDLIAAGQVLNTDISLLYGFDGTNWERLRTDTLGSLDVNITTALPSGANTLGSVNTLHSITSIAHGVKTIAVAGTDEALVGVSTPCKKVTIQAQTDNTGWVAIGTAGVDATEATGTGVLLGAGDAYELEIDNLAGIYIDATVSGEGVRYTYFN